MADDNMLSGGDDNLADGETRYLGHDSGLPDHNTAPRPSTQLAFGHQVVGRAFIAATAIPFVAFCMLKEKGGLRERLMGGFGACQHMHAAWSGGPLG